MSKHDTFEVVNDFNPTPTAKRGVTSVLSPVAEAARENPGNWVRLKRQMSVHYKAQAVNWLHKNYGDGFSVHTEINANKTKCSVYVRYDPELANQ